MAKNHDMAVIATQDEDADGRKASRPARPAQRGDSEVPETTELHGFDSNWPRQNAEGGFGNAHEQLSVRTIVSRIIPRLGYGPGCRSVPWRSSWLSFPELLRPLLGYVLEAIHK